MVQAVVYGNNLTHMIALLRCWTFISSSSVAAVFMLNIYYVLLQLHNYLPLTATASPPPSRHHTLLLIVLRLPYHSRHNQQTANAGSISDAISGACYCSHTHSALVHSGHCGQLRRRVIASSHPAAHGTITTSFSLRSYTPHVATNPVNRTPDHDPDRQ